MNSLSRVEINTLAIKNNIQQFRKILPKNYKIAGVVKSNAYGHGMIPLAGFLERNSLVEYFAVANDLEALALRKNNIKLPIIVLSYWNEKNLQNLVSQNIELGIYSHEQIKMLTGLKAKVKVHVKIDTGMNRLGIKPEEVEKYITEIKKNVNIKLQGIFSHFPIADENEEFTKKQFLQFKEIVAKISRKIDISLIHTANSAGALFMDETCNLLRLGIAMYGLQPSIKNPQFNIQPVLTWKTKVIQIKNVPAGERLSYGLTYQFSRDAKIAILPVGYADGYDRKLSNCGEVLIRGKRCPVRGRVCMNLIMVEVGNDVKINDEVVLIGKQACLSDMQGNEEITADDLAEKIGTINYEVVARISPEIERVYK